MEYWWLQVEGTVRRLIGNLGIRDASWDGPLGLDPKIARAGWRSLSLGSVWFQVLKTRT